MSKIKIGGMIKNANLAKVSVLGIPSRPGTAGAILGALGQAKINVQFIVQCLDNNNLDHVVFCIKQDDLLATLDIVNQLQERIGAQNIGHNPNVCTISIFGPDFRERPAIAGAMFGALAAKGINILAISTSISTISCVIAGQFLDLGEAAIRETFDLL